MLKALLSAKWLIFFILLFHLILLLTLRFTSWPEMTFWPYLMLKGWLPWRDIAIAHTPLLLVDLSIFYKIFGLGLVQLKVYTWILILATDFLLYWVAKRLWDKKIALLSLLFYIPLQIFYEGNGLWFDLALAPLALAIYYNLEKKKYLWAGIWWGIAFFTKQTAIWFVIPIFFTILHTPFNKAKKIALGAAAVSLIFFLALLLLGLWADFWLWAVKFGVAKLPLSYGQMKFPTIRLFLIAALPFFILTLTTLRLKKSYSVLSWVIFASLGVVPRWELFHFQPALPFLAIGLGIITSELSRLRQVERIAVAIGLLLFAVVISRQGIRDFRGGTRFFEPEVLKIADYINDNTEKDEEIYLGNAWDSIYVLSETIPAGRPWLPYLSWYLEVHGIQDVVVDDLVLDPPNLIVLGEYQESGLGSYKPKAIDSFILENYKLTDKIDGYEIWRLK